MSENILNKLDKSKTPQAKEIFNIRDAIASDLPDIVELDTKNTGLEKADYWSNAFELYGNSSEGFFHIAENNSCFCGFILGEVRAWEFGSPPCGWIFALGVHNEAREMGVGSKLFESVCDHFREVGINKVRTMLARSDHLNMSFFRSQGMRGGPFIQLEKNVAD
ncbi:MAG: GNAT family N-acetyltransferase [SAR324 cluster bacterium]|nr:GNAT family N-acetyltransferase [SAR324 cluster bacterium]